MHRLRLSLEGYYKHYSDYPASLARDYLVLANTGAGFGGADEGFASFGLEPLATIVAYASAAVDPKIMGTGPIPATQSSRLHWQH